MAILKLYGGPYTSSTRRVAMILHEKQVPFEFIPVRLFHRDHKTPEYLEKQPFGLVPYIDDDAFILYESRAICRYIVAKYANQGTKGLVPEDMKGHAIFEQAASTEMGSFDPHATKIVYEKYFKPMREEVTNEAVLESAMETLSSNLDVYDRILGKQKYIAGNVLTLADLFHIPYGYLLGVAGVDVLESRPNVARWFKDISSRESWEAVRESVKGTA